MKTPLIVKPGDRWLQRLFDEFNHRNDVARRAYQQSEHSTHRQRDDYTLRGTLEPTTGKKEQG